MMKSEGLLSEETKNRAMGTSTMESIATELKRQQKDIDGLEKTNSSLREQLGRATSANQTLYSDNQSLLKKNTELETDLTKALQMNFTLKTNARESSSTISDLQSKLLEQSGIITSLNGTIATMSESDKILKENQKLTQTVETLRNEVSSTKDECAERIRLVKEESYKTIEAVNTYQKNLDGREAILHDREVSADSHIESRAQELYSARRQALEEEYIEKEREMRRSYTNKKMFLIGYFIYMSFYGIMVTLLQLGRSKRFTTDLFAAGKAIFGAGTWYVSGTKWIADHVAGMAKKIPNDTASAIVYGLLELIIFLIALALVAAVGWVLYKLIRFCYEEFGDVASLGYMMFSLSVIVWGIDQYGKWIPINTVLVYLICVVVFFGIRAYLKRYELRNPFKKKEE